MNGVALVVAGRYAQALVNVFGVHQEWLESLQEASLLLQHNRSVLVMLSLPTIVLEHKINIMRTMFGRIPCISALEALLRVLVADKRVLLMAKVLENVITLYNQALKSIACTITSSHPLSEVDKRIIQEFIEKKTGKSVRRGVYKVDRSLIAGVRIQAHTAFWEYSIRKQLRALRIALVR